MEPSILSLNRDCLNEIFKHLSTEEKHRVQQVCKLFQTISRDALGITLRQPTFEKLGNEIKQLLKEAKKKRHQLFTTAASMTTAKHTSDQWNRTEMVKIIRRFNAMYNDIEQEVDPEYVLNNITNIRFNVVYSHEGKCENIDPFDTHGCSCPIISFNLSFSYAHSDRTGTFTSSYSRYRKKQWDGYFKKTLVKHFDADRLVHGGFSSGHLLEHIVFRVMQAEIAYRTLHHQDIFGVDNDYYCSSSSSENESDTEGPEEPENPDEDIDGNEIDGVEPGFDLQGAEPPPGIFYRMLIQHMQEHPEQFQVHFEPAAPDQEPDAI